MPVFKAGLNLFTVRKYTGSAPMVSSLKIPDHIKPFYRDINSAIAVLNTEGYKPNGIFERQAITAEMARAHGRLDMAGLPGGLLELGTGKKIVFVGDLHANVPNLLAIISKYGDAIRREEIILVVLGDAIHPEKGDMADMRSSMEIMDIIIALKGEYPDFFHYIRGNHDAFGGFLKRNEKGELIGQGEKHREHLVAQRGEAYALKMGEFWSACPLVVRVGDRALAAHSAVIPGGLSREDAISSRLTVRGGVGQQLLWSTHEWRGEGTILYGDTDVVATRKKMGLVPDAPIISGHTPNRVDAVYQPKGMPGHWIIISSYESPRIPLLVIELEGRAAKIVAVISPS